MQSEAQTRPFTCADGVLRQWIALYTRPRHEKRVAAGIREKGIEVYLPLLPVLRRWSDRRKWVDEPLFRGYVFVRGDDSERYRSVQTSGVVRMVRFRGKPAVVRDEEIDRIRRILRDGLEVEACDPFSVGDRVVIKQGPLTGVEGRLVEIHGSSRLVVTVPSINQALRFSVERNDVRLLQESV